MLLALERVTCRSPVQRASGVAFTHAAVPIHRRYDASDSVASEGAELSPDVEES